MYCLGLFLVVILKFYHDDACHSAFQCYLQIKERIPQWPQFSKVEEPEKLYLSLGKVVEIAWKFVTQPNPIIVCQPETSVFDNDLHKKYFGRWKEGQGDLIYAEPVVFRSYHGDVMCKAFVGNTPSEV